MNRFWQLLALTLALIVLAYAAAPALAHQPYFEEEDIRADTPWLIRDPTISTALYATLASRSDVDYVRFEGQAGQSILLALSIPQIEGQEGFAPTMALLGPGLPTAELPPKVDQVKDGGALLLPAPQGPAPEFFEPFSRTSYWERQEQRVTLPADGWYTVAVWHDMGAVGRYVFVIGDKERLGGDPAFPAKMKTYWTPVTAPPAVLPRCLGSFIQ